MEKLRIKIPSKQCGNEQLASASIDLNKLIKIFPLPCDEICVPEYCGFVILINKNEIRGLEICHSTKTINIIKITIIA